MPTLRLIILLLLVVAEAPAQHLTFKWGPAINHEPRQLQGMQVIGVTSSGFYASFEEGSQVTLEFYNNQSQRLWATALLSKTPQGQPTQFYKAVLLQSRLYILSTYTAAGRTTVYAQQISESGNYDAAIKPLVSSSVGSHLTTAISPDQGSLLLVQSGAGQGPAAATLLSAALEPLWSQNFRAAGRVQEAVVLPGQAAFVLTRAPLSAPAAAALKLYRFHDGNGKLSEMALGAEAYRPLQAKLAVTADGDVAVAGYFAPASEAASQKPEPAGTFYYRLGSKELPNGTSQYNLFPPGFLSAYKKYKPDHDLSQRLRNLQAGKLLPVGENDVALIGETSYEELVSGAAITHQNDVLLTRFGPDGKPRFTTTANKQQESTADGSELGSYFATAIADSVQLLYLDFEYNYTAENTIVMASPSAIMKTPVLITVGPRGRQIVRPLKSAQADRHHKFYLRPTATFPVSEREFIVLGIGDGYYKYGRMQFQEQAAPQE